MLSVFISPTKVAELETPKSQRNKGMNEEFPSHIHIHLDLESGLISQVCVKKRNH